MAQLIDRESIPLRVRVPPIAQQYIIMSKFTFFWNNRTPFSNWYPSVFIWNGIRFTRGEQYMMFRKAMLFGEWDIADQILATDIPAKQKDLGREVKNYDDDKWAAVRFDIMVEGLYEKFNQNPQLKKAQIGRASCRERVLRLV